MTTCCRRRRPSKRADGDDLVDEARQARGLALRSATLMSALFTRARLGKLAETGDAWSIAGAIGDSLDRHPDAFLTVMHLRSADEYTYLHSLSVCAMMQAVARHMGLDRGECLDAGLAGLLHDLGKTLTPPAILNKPGRLTAAEMRIVRRHTEDGRSMLESAGIAHRASLDAALHHHEKFDGSGYPHGLAGERIPLVARIASVCDVYDALTVDRPYRTALAPGEALRRMQSWQGHFDGNALHCLVKAIGLYPGSASCPSP